MTEPDTVQAMCACRQGGFVGFVYASDATFKSGTVRCGKRVFRVRRAVPGTGFAFKCNNCDGSGWIAMDRAAAEELTKELTAAQAEVVSFQRKYTTAMAEVARLRKVTGPDCPLCGRTLRAEHRQSWNPPRGEIRFYRNWYTDERPVVGQPYACEFYLSDLLANHPAIAREMGVSE